MNAGIKLAAVYMAVAILVAGCGQSNSGSTGTSPSQPASGNTSSSQPKATNPVETKPAESKPAAPQDPTIKIKGLYIGMDIHTVPALFREKSAGKWPYISNVLKGAGILVNQEQFYVRVGDLGIIKVSEINTDITDVPYVEYEKAAALFGGTQGMVTAGLDGKVVRIVLLGVIVNDLFNAADMEVSAFVQQFANSYNIPEMKVSDDFQSWIYTSPDGVKVTIDKDKGLVIEKVASTQERKQSFD